MNEEVFMYLIHNPESKYPQGWGNGYVAVPKGHPLFGLHYVDAMEKTFTPQELTYSQKVGEYWVFGWDTRHLNDTIEKWPLSEVMIETKKLLDIIKNYSE